MHGVPSVFRGNDLFVAVLAFARDRRPALAINLSSANHLYWHYKVDPD